MVLRIILLLGCLVIVGGCLGISLKAFHSRLVWSRNEIVQTKPSFALNAEGIDIFHKAVSIEKQRRRVVGEQSVFCCGHSKFSGQIEVVLRNYQHVIERQDFMGLVSRLGRNVAQGIYFLHARTRPYDSRWRLSEVFEVNRIDEIPVHCELVDVVLCGYPRTFGTSGEIRLTVNHEERSQKDNEGQGSENYIRYVPGVSGLRDYLNSINPVGRLCVGVFFLGVTLWLTFYATGRPTSIQFVLFMASALVPSMICFAIIWDWLFRLSGW